MNPRIKSVMNYILPSMGGLFVTYLYNVLDGIFVGQGVGADALGAVNVGVPFITFAVAVSAMFPMGGATIVAIKIGKGDNAGANHIFEMSFTLTLLLSSFLMIVGMVFSRQITCMSGARELSVEMQQMAADYLYYYCAFSVPMLISTCLSVFVRNDGSPALSFTGMCIGAIANIFLDWLFIFPLEMGVIGAAIASGLGQIFSMLILLSHFARKKGILRLKLLRIELPLLKNICRRGMPEAVTQLTTPVTALCYNLILSNMIGDVGVSTFSVLSFISSLANAILSGVAQGLQPLWGIGYGRKNTEEIRWYFHCGMIINSVLSLFIYGILVSYNLPVIRIFNRDAVLVQTASSALPLFALSFLPMSVNLIYTAYLFSTKRTTAANLIAISRGIVVKACLILLIPLLFGARFIWAAPLITELFTLLFAIRLEKTAGLLYK